MKQLIKTNIFGFIKRKREEFFWALKTAYDDDAQGKALGSV